MSITKQAKTKAAVALSAFMLLALGVQAGPTEVRQSSLVDVLEEELVMDTPVGGSPRDDHDLQNSCSGDVFKLLPTGHLVMTVSSWYPQDTRDSESYFACSTRDTSKYMSAAFESFNEDYFNSPFRMRIVEARSSSAAAQRVKGWYLTVQEGNDRDKQYPGYIRLSADKNVESAAWWILRKENDIDYLTVAFAPNAPSIRYHEQWALSIPPGSRRDRLTNYFAVGPTAGEGNDLSFAVSFERTAVL